MINCHDPDVEYTGSVLFYKERRTWDSLEDTEYINIDSHISVQFNCSFMSWKGERRCEISDNFFFFFLLVKGENRQCTLFKQAASEKMRLIRHSLLKSWEEEKQSGEEEWSLYTRKKRTKKTLLFSIVCVVFLFFIILESHSLVSVVCCYCVWELLRRQFFVFSKHFESIKWASSVQGLPSYCPIWERRRKFREGKNHFAASQ